MGHRVLSLPSLDLHDCVCQTNRQMDYVNKRHTSVNDVYMSVFEQHPVSCMNDNDAILGSSTYCGSINSSHSSSSNSVSISDTLRLVQLFTTVYDNEDSRSLPELSELSAPILQHAMDEERQDIIANAAPVQTIVEEKSSLVPLTHKLSVPSKAAAILGAREVFIAPSHAAYRRLVDFTHRPTSDGQSLLNTDAPYLPTLSHPSLTARTHRKSKPDTNSADTSPETRVPNKYKIIGMGIDEVKEKLNFLRRPGELTTSTVNSDSGSAKTLKSKDSDRSIKGGGTSVQQIRKWGNSFDELLHDPYGLALFHEYLKSEYSEENIEFWIACEEYRAIANPKKMIIRAHKIIKDFVATQASKEINLDSKTRQQTLENISHPNIKMFEMAQKRIQTLMEIDSYQRFLRSGMYQSLLQDITNASPTNNQATCNPTTVSVAVKAQDEVNKSAFSNVNFPDSDNAQSLADLRASGSLKRSIKPCNHPSIIRISSVRGTRNEGSAEPGITPSNSENCFKNVTR